MIKWLSFFTSVVDGSEFRLSWVAAGTVAAGYLAGEGAKDAAGKGAAGQEAGIIEQRRQYDQARQDSAPYREVATGKPIYAGGVSPIQWDEKTAELKRARDAGEITMREWQQAIFEKGDRPDDSSITGYAGGALQELAGYGRSKVDEVAPFEFDYGAYKDPGYDFRVAESERALNRNAAGMGKVVSGNRLRGIMDLNQEMASQEYGAARGRALQDYSLNVVDPYARAYGRETDYLNRQSSLANIGQTSTSELGRLGAGSASNIAGMYGNIGKYGAAGTLGQYGAYSKAFGDLGKIGQDYYQSRQAPQSSRGGTGNNPYVEGDAYGPAYR